MCNKHNILKDAKIIKYVKLIINIHIVIKGNVCGYMSITKRRLFG